MPPARPKLLSRVETAVKKIDKKLRDLYLGELEDHSGIG
jgi:hypothetical protein